MKRGRGLAVKLFALIIISMSVLSVCLCVTSSIEHGGKVDQYYSDDASRLALSLANQTDGDFIRALRELVDEEEFIRIREKADETGDYEPIGAYLEKKGMLDGYNALSATYVQFLKDMNVKYLYIHSIEGPVSVYLISATAEGFFALGYVEPNAEEFAAYTTNVHIDPAVSNVNNDWVCSAYEPIYDSRGEAVSTVGVDIDMNKVMADRTQFLSRMVIYSVLITILACALGVILIRRMAVKPIEALSAESKRFTDEESGYSKESVIALDIHSHDELEDLCDNIRTMQEKILEYIDNITKVTAEKERIGAELNVATQIQASMLPRIFPPFPDRPEFDLFASMDPAKEVGGDFYDFFLIDDRHLALVMADVSGKGVPAALFMAISKTLIKDRGLESYDPAKVLSNANDQLAEANDEGLFVTVWLGIVDLTTGVVNFSDAGHEYPVIIHPDGTTELVKAKKKKPPVATMEGIPYITSTVTMAPGDMLFLYTDGVPEATNASDELYGMERLEAVLQKSYTLPVNELLPAVRRDVDAFVGAAPQFDDLTMLAIKLKSLRTVKE